MTIHKLFKELQKLSEDERDLLQESIRESANVKRTCENLGVKYSDKLLINWIKKTGGYRLAKAVNPVQTTTGPSSASDPTIEKMKKIILGDNLDIIEEAAKKKGLL